MTSAPTKTPSSSPPTALVTGATSGIGQEVVRQMCAQGWRVAGVGRKQDALDALREELGEQKFVGVRADLSTADLAQLVRQALQALDSDALCTLVNAAGVFASGSIQETSIEEFSWMMDLNVRVPFELTKWSIAALIKGQERWQDASVINISSISGARPYANVSAYCTSKAALDHMTRCHAIEFAPQKVRVNAVNPGVVVTELHKRGGMAEADYQAFLHHCTTTHPLGRVGQSPEIADLVVFLASSRASWITGETISIDGGRHLAGSR